mmetsp:Transcript_21774/g.32576  ORF Transcript_21774/g.32576 Transcript_21774/m.32576 type:complete len:231 (-) Transcript_21774:263-955(-)
MGATDAMGDALGRLNGAIGWGDSGTALCRRLRLCGLPGHRLRGGQCPTGQRVVRPRDRLPGLWCRWQCSGWRIFKQVVSREDDRCIFPSRWICGRACNDGTSCPCISWTFGPHTEGDFGCRGACGCSSKRCLPKGHDGIQRSVRHCGLVDNCMHRLSRSYQGIRGWPHRPHPPPPKFPQALVLEVCVRQFSLEVQRAESPPKLQRSGHLELFNCIANRFFGEFGRIPIRK